MTLVTERILATTPRFVCPRMDFLAWIANVPELSILRAALNPPSFLNPIFFQYQFTILAKSSEAICRLCCEIYPTKPVRHRRVFL
jgi:hypothetical protein